MTEDAAAAEKMNPEKLTDEEISRKRAERMEKEDEQKQAEYDLKHQKIVDYVQELESNRKEQQHRPHNINERSSALKEFQDKQEFDEFVAMENEDEFF